MINIAIFASGSGSNAESIIQYFKDNENICVACVLANKAEAYVLERATNHRIDHFVFNKEEFLGDTVIQYLEQKKTDLIVLAGFLWLIPENYLKYPILNIHPALLPKYGGKGLYGMHVHRAVKEAGEMESGMTIHLVNENYDEGDILFQERCAIEYSDTPETIAKKVLELEHKNYPRVIEQFIINNIKKL